MQDLSHALSREGHLKHEVDKLKKQIKAFRMEHEAFMEHVEKSGSGALPSAAVKQYAGAMVQLGDPNMPSHLQPVDKSDADELEQKVGAACACLHLLVGHSTCLRRRLVGSVAWLSRMRR